MEYKKKLIEVALPLDAINEASAREKSIRHGHPSTLHLWWARRPLAAARAVIWASLVDDPSSLPEQFPTEEEQNKERERLFGILERLVKWENTNNQEVLDEARAEIMKSTGGNPPPLLDPFAGGGSIPLEAQRLGLEAYASDLNPVAVMINKAMIEIPPKFANQPPVNPEARQMMHKKWPGTSGLAEDVRYYGEWLKQEAFKRIGYLYPKVKDKNGQEHTVIAWIWARTVQCPNPACGCEMPLANSFALSKRRGKEVYIQPIFEDNKFNYKITSEKKKIIEPKIGRGKFRCIACNSPVDLGYIRDEFKAKRMKCQMLAIVAEGKGGRLYFPPNIEHIRIANVKKPNKYPNGLLSGKSKVNVGTYGIKEFSELFTNRQLHALVTLSELISVTKEEIIKDGGSMEYALAVCTYLSFVIDKQVDFSSTITTWINASQSIRNTFARQAIPMTWDYAETNIFSNSSGSFSNMLDLIVKSIKNLPYQGKSGKVIQANAREDNGLRKVMVSTDPPYYDNISYADLSDYFYIWLRLSLKEYYPDIFQTLLVPKAEELVATEYRFDGDRRKAMDFFEEGMSEVFKLINTYVVDDVPTTVYYAYKENEKYGHNNASTGWETMLSAIIKSGFCITGTWPIRTERYGRMLDVGKNALASSIVLVCRKRSPNAPLCTRRDFINSLKRELKPALEKLQASNIAPVDLAQSAIGPGMAVYSRYSKVLEADGTPMSVRSALQIINQELDLYFSEQDGVLDSDSRFCVDLYTQYAFNDVQFGEADVLARAKNTSVERLAEQGIVYAEKGIVRLLTREEISDYFDKRSKGVIWLLTQQLTYALEQEGVNGAAKIVADIFTSEPEYAKTLAYRLYQIAEQKGWAQEAYAYNSLVISWPEIQNRAAEISARERASEQVSFFSIENND